MVQYRPPEGSTARARKLGRNATGAERCLWRLLRENFPDRGFRRQVPIRSFFADFASHQSKIVIECDGSQHGSPRDEERTRLIEAEGYRVLRFWNHDVLGNADSVALAIARALHDRSPPPQPSPIQGEGDRSDECR